MSGLERDCDGGVDDCPEVSEQVVLVEDVDVDSLAELSRKVNELEGEVARLEAIEAEHIRNLGLGRTNSAIEVQYRQMTEGLDDKRRKLAALKVQLTLERLKRS